MHSRRDVEIQAVRLPTDEVHVLYPGGGSLSLTEQSWVVDGDHRYLLNACAGRIDPPDRGQSLVAGEVGIALVDSLGHTCAPRLETRRPPDWPRPRCTR